LAFSTHRIAIEGKGHPRGHRSLDGFKGPKLGFLLPNASATFMNGLGRLPGHLEFSLNQGQEISVTQRGLLLDQLACGSASRTARASWMSLRVRPMPSTVAGEKLFSSGTAFPRCPSDRTSPSFLCRIVFVGEAAEATKASRDSHSNDFVLNSISY